MTDVTVPTAPALATIAGVELMHVGQWAISTGTATFTTDDLYAAVAALDCPAVRRPVLKLGHLEPDPNEAGIRWDGEPAVGWVGNLAVAENGRTLVGDYVGMPGWLGDVMASAYPDRSIEGWYDFRCQLDHTHPFVLTAVALLGVTAPGIGTLQSLQDVAALYGVAASDSPAPVGTPVRIHAAREDRVPNPNPTQVAAGVTTEDVRRAFYNSSYGSGYSKWITEMQLGPELQLIVCDDSDNSYARVPVVIGDGDGQDAVSFGDPTTVVIRYEDAGQVAASAGPAPVRYASRKESRPGERPKASEPEPPADPEQDVPEAEPSPAEPATDSPSPAPAVEVPSPTTTEGAGMSLDPAKIRDALGLAPEASDEEVAAALAASGLTPQPPAEPEPSPEEEREEGEPETQVEEPAAPATLPEGIVTIDASTLANLREMAEQGVAARARQLTEDRDRTIKAAIDEGKIPPARKAHFEQLWKADPDGARQTLASLAPGLVPVADQGVPGGAEEAAVDYSDIDRLFTAPVPTRQGA